jgi:hypothetical protein
MLLQKNVNTDTNIGAHYRLKKFAEQLIKDITIYIIKW